MVVPKFKNVLVNLSTTFAYPYCIIIHYGCCPILSRTRVYESLSKHEVEGNLPPLYLYYIIPFIPYYDLPRTY